jgi:hypothetical protein
MAKLVFSGALGRESIEALSPYTKGLLTGVAEELGLERITVTSTIRSTRAQAEAMYNNIASGRYIRYRKAGQAVTDLCVRMLGKQESREKTIEAMQALIEELSEKGERVSRHCVSDEEYAKCNIVDIAKTMTYDQAIRLFRVLLDRECVTKIIQPITSSVKIEGLSFDSAEPAIHIEVNIPKQYQI